VQALYGPPRLQASGAVVFTAIPPLMSAMTPTQLFVAFFKIGLQGFGVVLGYAGRI
jgi:hypothetical protein